jgi:hypothetical protein
MTWINKNFKSVHELRQNHHTWPEIKSLLNFPCHSRHLNASYLKEIARLENPITQRIPLTHGAMRYYQHLRLTKQAVIIRTGWSYNVVKSCEVVFDCQLPMSIKQNRKDASKIKHLVEEVRLHASAGLDAHEISEKIGKTYDYTRSLAYQNGIKIVKINRKDFKCLKSKDNNSGSLFNHAPKEIKKILFTAWR